MWYQRIGASLAMPYHLPAARTAAAILSSFVAAASAGAAPDARAGVTIRGRGNSVVVEGDAARFTRRTALRHEVLSEAARLKQRGADDVLVVGYLRAHQADLPSIIEAGDIARLRRAGAGKSVFGYLISVAAVDIGPTGEGRRAYPAMVSAPRPEVEGFSNELMDGYGYGGIAAPYGIAAPRFRRGHEPGRPRMAPRFLRPRRFFP